MVPLLALVASEMAWVSCETTLPKGRIGHLQLPRHQVGALRKGIVLLNLVEQQHIFSGGHRILAQRGDAHAARQLGGQLLLVGLRLVQRATRFET